MCSSDLTGQVTRTLAELKETAPSFYSEARSMVDEFKFAKALAKINYAISLRPEDARFHALRGNILQSQLNLPEARAAYAHALELDPELPWAEQNLKLCDKLLAENPACQKSIVKQLVRYCLGREETAAEQPAIEGATLHEPDLPRTRAAVQRARILLASHETLARRRDHRGEARIVVDHQHALGHPPSIGPLHRDRKSTRLNSSH